MRRLAIIALAALLCGCRAQKEAAVSDSSVESHRVEIRTDTVRTVSLIRDTVATRDSVFICQRGDTVLIREIHYRDRIREAADSHYQAHADSSASEKQKVITRTITRTVERRQSVAERFGPSIVASALLSLALAVAIGWRKYRGT